MEEEGEKNITLKKRRRIEKKKTTFKNSKRKTYLVPTNKHDVQNMKGIDEFRWHLLMSASDNAIILKFTLFSNGKTH